MPLDWKEIEAQGIGVTRALDRDGNRIAVAWAGYDPALVHTIYLGCPWDIYDQFGDLSRESRYYGGCDIFELTL